jgi:hypothetical protein
MYYHQAMKAPNQKEFIKAIDKDITGQSNNGNFSIIPRSSVPLDKRVFPAVWAMRWKARLNIDGSKQVQGHDYKPTLQ